MTYIVMEVHKSYAILLDEKGRFLNAANLGYELGQRIQDPVLESRDISEIKGSSSALKRISPILAAVACFALIMIGAWQYLNNSVGTVRIQINPDIILSVNHFDNVSDAEALNEDGAILLREIDIKGVKVEVATDMIADCAIQLGYLNDGGEIRITVNSDNSEWKRNIGGLVTTELDNHLAHKMRITEITADSVTVEEPADTTVSITESAPTTETSPTTEAVAPAESAPLIETEPNPIFSDTTAAPPIIPDTLPPQNTIIINDPQNNDDDDDDNDNDHDDEDDDWDDEDDDRYNNENSNSIDHYDDDDIYDDRDNTDGNGDDDDNDDDDEDEEDEDDGNDDDDGDDHKKEDEDDDKDEDD